MIYGQQGNELSADAIAKIITNTVGDLPVYLTFDIDALDPVFVSVMGAKVCGGLTTYNVLI
ncbi:hypothetical protein MTsN2n4_05540 [Pseudoalteromonas sp. MTN2-4]